MRYPSVTKTFLLVCGAAMSSGCSSDLDGAIVVINGQPYELQHRFLDAYVAHKISPEEIEKARNLIETQQRENQQNEPRPMG